MSARVENVVTSGTFSLDGGTWEVDNNVWIIGDENEVMVIDPAHDVAKIREAIGEREVMAVLLTHGHDDHIRAAAQFSDEVDAPLFLNPEDQMLWDAVYPEREIDAEIHEGDSFTVAGTSFTALHTPGHSPGSTCFYAEDLGVLFSGDTLFNGGPGATGRSYSSFDTIIDSIQSKLLTLPAQTVVNTGHGDSTSIGAEAPHLQEWIARGH
ncbi:MBL fold metallo-hydrolase [Glutamicibacter sp.]|uniref:MBL fold metallo-hydrolase n=1 Tax=Glutamicibacter sp. TaxID=1931995 RepID=UPI0028BF0599|nr:MBL fold metallo-hydrolase [Glutamicibacter sp.]